MHQKQAELVLTLKSEQQKQVQLDELLLQTREQLANTFNKLSDEALTRNNDNFLKLAEQNLKRFQSEAKAELGSKEKSIEQMLKPINEALQQTSKQIHQIEKERKETYGSLSSTIAQVSQGQQQLQQETQNLVQALRRPEVRGKWGEMTLRRLAEISGMVAHCDFYEQPHTVTDSCSISGGYIDHHRSALFIARLVLDILERGTQHVDQTTQPGNDNPRRRVRRSRLVMNQPRCWRSTSARPNNIGRLSDENFCI